MKNGTAGFSFSSSWTPPLHFTAQPILFKTPLNQLEGEAGETVIFRCELTKPGASVLWRKDQKVLQSSNKHQFRQDGAVVELVISKLQEADSGEYSCDSGYDTTAAQLMVKGRNQYSTFLTSSSDSEHCTSIPCHLLHGSTHIFHIFPCKTSKALLSFFPTVPFSLQLFSFFLHGRHFSHFILLLPPPVPSCVAAWFFFGVNVNDVTCLTSIGTYYNC